MAKRETIDADVWPEVAYFAAQVKMHRESRGLSQDKLAEMTGLTQAYLSSIERRETNASMLVMAQISRGLDIPMAELVMPGVGKSKHQN